MRTRLSEKISETICLIAKEIGADCLLSDSAVIQHLYDFLTKMTLLKLFPMGTERCIGLRASLLLPARKNQQARSLFL
jgi:hypothetical protein